MREYRNWYHLRRYRSGYPPGYYIDRYGQEILREQISGRKRYPGAFVFYDPEEKRAFREGKRLQEDH